MVRPCSFSIDCEGSDFPITNYSSEGPETNPLNPCLWFPGTWKDVGGLNLCVSEGGNPTDCFVCAKKPIDPPDPTKLCNEEQTCTVECPGGTTVSYTVPAGIFCDNDDGLPPTAPTPPDPSSPLPLPPPPPVLGITVQSTTFTPGVNITKIVLRCVGLDPLGYYKITYTVTVPDSEQDWGTEPGFTAIRTALFDHVGSSYDFTDDAVGYVIASVTNLSIKTTIPKPSLEVSRVGFSLNYSFKGMVPGLRYAGRYEIKPYGTGDWLTLGIPSVLATASTYNGTDAFFFYSYPNALLGSGYAWPVDENGVEIPI